MRRYRNQSSSRTRHPQARGGQAPDSAAHPLIGRRRFRQRYGGRGNAGPIPAAHNSLDPRHRESLFVPTLASAHDHRRDRGGHRARSQRGGERGAGLIPIRVRSGRRRYPCGPRFNFPPFPDRPGFRFPRGVHAEERGRGIRRGRATTPPWLCDGPLPRARRIDWGQWDPVYDGAVRRSDPHRDERRHHRRRPLRTEPPEGPCGPNDLGGSGRRRRPRPGCPFRCRRDDGGPGKLR